MYCYKEHGKTTIQHIDNTDRALLEKFILSAAKIFIETTTAYFEVDICSFNLNIATKALTISLFGYIIAYGK